MPLEQDELFGTNANRSKNEEYCIYCFKNDRYTQAVTMDEMIEHEQTMSMTSTGIQGSTWSGMRQFNK
jgi:hypothetical protein